MSIEIKNLSRRFGQFQALNDISLKIQAGELVALLGPSGCGKTTLLRIIAGLETSDRGQVLFSGEDATNVPVRHRQVGFVFQHYALFQHMSVFENVAFGLRVRPRAERLPEKQIKRRVTELLELVQLGWVSDRYPAQLSGGQRQRIALARALAVDPKVLLLDEPFGALDAQVRKELRRWLRELHNELNVASVFVTHDQQEALEVADRIVIMNRGQIEQIGTPDEVWTSPATPFVYDFLGNANRFNGQLHQGELISEGIRFPAQSVQGASYGQAAAYVRSHDFELSRTHFDSDGLPAFAARVQRAYLSGSTAHLELLREDVGQRIEVELPEPVFRDLNLQEGEGIHARARNVQIFNLEAQAH